MVKIIKKNSKRWADRVVKLQERIVTITSWKGKMTRNNDNNGQAEWKKYWKDW